MEVDHVNESIASMLPGTAAAVGPAESERSYKFCEIMAYPSHPGFDNR